MNFEQIDSPALLVYPEVVRKNIAEMIKMAGSVTRLRPHIKTHKTAEGIRMMQEQGIFKFKCATIAEAELLSTNQAKDVLLAHQPVGLKIERLIKLINTYPSTVFSTIVDDIDQAKIIASKCNEASIILHVYIDLNVGMNRSGISPDERAIDLYEYVQSAESLQFQGLHVYDGQHRQSIPEEREKACDTAFQQVYSWIEKIVQKGYPQPLIVAGGSPSFSIHAKHHDRECSPGTNIFWDHGYATICPEQHFTPAVQVLTRVISKPSSNRVCLDLGHKAIASENEINKRIYFPEHQDLKPVGQSEEHLVMETMYPENYTVGDYIIGIPYHICPTVALHESLIAIENDKVVGEWNVAARKRKISI
jgi:D-serine deaminase-like pyridoxal phosphate-dependent protein